MTIFQKGGSTHVPPTLLVIRVVLLHTLYGVSNPLIPQLYVDRILQHKEIYTYSWGIKGFDKLLFYGVKLPLLRAVWAGQGLILPLEK